MALVNELAPPGKVESHKEATEATRTILCQKYAVMTLVLSRCDHTPQEPSEIPIQFEFLYLPYMD